MVLLRRTGIRTIIYLDDMLIIGRIKEETRAQRDTDIALLQCLEFEINQSKLLMTLVQEMKFLGLFPFNGKKYNN